MFDLEKQITEWRREMRVGGLKNHAVLDELESHLRDDLAEQIRAGADAQTAFEGAVQRLGGPQSIKSEFAKTDGNILSLWISLAGWFFLAAFITWLNFRLWDQLQTICLTDIVMLSLVLPLIAARRCREKLAMRKHFARTVWAGQLGVALGGTLIVLSPQYAVWGLALAIMSVVVCAIRLARLARITTLATA